MATLISKRYPRHLWIPSHIQVSSLSSTSVMRRLYRNSSFQGSTVVNIWDPPAHPVHLEETCSGIGIDTTLHPHPRRRWWHCCSKWRTSDYEKRSKQGGGSRPVIIGRFLTCWTKKHVSFIYWLGSALFEKRNVTHLVPHGNEKFSIVDIVFQRQTHQTAGTPGKGWMWESVDSLTTIGEKHEFLNFWSKSMLLDERNTAHWPCMRAMTFY